LKSIFTYKEGEGHRKTAEMKEKGSNE